MPDTTPETVTLALLLTGAGATVAATIIASVIEILKRLPGIGEALDAGRETLLATIFSGVLIGYAFVVTTPVIDAFNGFAAFLAWIAVAKLAGAAYDTGRAIKAAVT